MRLLEQQATFAKNVATLIGYIFLKNYQCSLGEVYRTEEQAALNAQRGTGIKDSLHCKRLAIDVHLFKDGVYLDKTEDYRLIGLFWETLNKHNRWGGSFSKPDGCHFEMMERL